MADTQRLADEAARLLSDELAGRGIAVSDNPGSVRRWMPGNDNEFVIMRRPDQDVGAAMKIVADRIYGESKRLTFVPVQKPEGAPSWAQGRHGGVIVSVIQLYEARHDETVNRFSVQLTNG